MEIEYNKDNRDKTQQCVDIAFDMVFCYSYNEDSETFRHLLIKEVIINLQIAYFWSK